MRVFRGVILCAKRLDNSRGVSRKTNVVEVAMNDDNVFSALEMDQGAIVLGQIPRLESGPFTVDVEAIVQNYAPDGSCMG